MPLFDEDTMARSTSVVRPLPDEDLAHLAEADLVPVFHPDTGDHSQRTKEDDYALLESMAYAALEKRDLGDEYAERLEQELEVIRQTGMAFVFLEAEHAAHLLRETGHARSPGRGSLGASLVLWLLGVARLDPIAHGFDFAMFLSPGRIAAGIPADADIDTSEAGRAVLDANLRARYGEGRVYGVMTFIYWGAKSSIQEAGRELEKGKVATYLSGLVRDPDTLPKARNREEEDVLLVAKAKLGALRTNGRHPGARLVLPRTAEEMRLPVHEDMLVLTLDQAERFIKLDYLVIAALDHAHRAAMRMTGLPGKEAMDRLWEIDVNHPGITQDLRCFGGDLIFQFAQPAAAEAAKKLEPRSFSDMVLATAICRPGTDANEVIARKHGRKPALPLHPALEDVTRESFGVIVYQEDACAVVKTLAGFTDEDASAMVKALSKKIPEKVAAYHEQFMSGARGHGLTEAEATRVFDALAKAAAYLYKRIHGSAYTVLSAWHIALRIRDPLAFCATYEELQTKPEHCALASAYRRKFNLPPVNHRQMHEEAARQRRAERKRERDHCEGQMGMFAPCGA